VPDRAVDIAPDGAGEALTGSKMTVVSRPVQRPSGRGEASGWGIVNCLSKLCTTRYCRDDCCAVPTRRVLPTTPRWAPRAEVNRLAPTFRPFPAEVRGARWLAAGPPARKPRRPFTRSTAFRGAGSGDRGQPGAVLAHAHRRVRRPMSPVHRECSSNQPAASLSGGAAGALTCPVWPGSPATDAPRAPTSCAAPATAPDSSA
jgi:hypothetical protein